MTTCLTSKQQPTFNFRLQHTTGHGGDYGRVHKFPMREPLSMLARSYFDGTQEGFCQVFLFFKQEI